MSVLTERPPVVVKGARLVTFDKRDYARLEYMRRKWRERADRLRREHKKRSR